MRVRALRLLLPTALAMLGGLMATATVVAQDDDSSPSPQPTGGLHVQLIAPADASGHVRVEVDGLGFVVEFDPSGPDFDRWVRVGGLAPGSHVVTLVNDASSLDYLSADCTPYPSNPSTDGFEVFVAPGAPMECRLRLQMEPVAPGTEASAGGIAVTPQTTPAEAEGSFGFVALPAEILGGFSIGFGGFGGGTLPGFDLEDILASPDLAGLSAMVEANETGLLPRATAPELSGLVMVILHELPPGYLVHGARCTDASGAVVGEASDLEGAGPPMVSVDALSSVGIGCTFDVERQPDASLTVVTATVPADAEGTFTFIDLPGAIEGAGGSLEGIEGLLGLLDGGGLPQPERFFGIGAGADFGPLAEGMLVAVEEQLAAMAGPWSIEANTPTAIGARAPGPHSIILAELEPGFAPHGVSCTAEAGSDTTASDPTDLTPDLGSSFNGLVLPVLASGPSAITIDLPPGAAVTCTFMVAPGTEASAGERADVGGATVRVDTEPPDKDVEFDVEVDGEALRIGPASPHQLPDPSEGSHQAVLTDPLPDHELVSHGCVNAEGADPRPYQRADDPPALTFGLGAEDVVCTFTLGPRASGSSEVLAPRAGRWRAVNAATAIACAGISTPLPRTTDNGRIAVKQGGARIVATGLGDGAKIVLDQVEGKPGLYRGTVKVKSQGVTMPLKYEMRVLDPEHIEGKLRADFKAAGQACVLKRDFTIDFRGE